MTFVGGAELRKLIDETKMNADLGESTGKYHDCAREILLAQRNFSSYTYNGNWKVAGEIMKILEKHFGPSDEKYPEFNTDRLCKHEWTPYPGKPSGKRCHCGAVTAVVGMEEEFEEEFKDFD